VPPFPDRIFGRECRRSPAQPGRGKGDSLAFEHDMGEHRGRTIFELDGKNAMNFRVEMSADGKRWDRAVDGKYRRRGH
jgi:hypothetical protein